SYSRYLQNAWTKYGEESFRFVVLERCLNEPIILVAREQYWIDKFKGNLFNLVAQAEPAVGTPHTLARKAATSKRMLGNKCGEGKFNRKQLSEDDVRSILTRYAAGEHRSVLAKDFGIHPISINRITGRRFYERVEVSPEIDAACKERARHHGRGKTNGQAKLF